MKRVSEKNYKKFKEYFTFSCVDLLIFEKDLVVHEYRKVFS